MVVWNVKVVYVFEICVSEIIIFYVEDVFYNVVF